MAERAVAGPRHGLVEAECSHGGVGVGRGDVPQTHVPDRGVVGTHGERSERETADRDIPVPGLVRRQAVVAKGGVVIACRVLVEASGTCPSIGAAGRVEAERLLADSRVGDACRIELQAQVAERRVRGSGGVGAQAVLAERGVAHTCRVPAEAFCAERRVGARAAGRSGLPRPVRVHETAGRAFDGSGDGQFLRRRRRANPDEAARRNPHPLCPGGGADLRCRELQVGAVGRVGPVLRRLEHHLSAALREPRRPVAAHRQPAQDVVGLHRARTRRGSPRGAVHHRQRAQGVAVDIEVRAGRRRRHRVE